MQRKPVLTLVIGALLLIGSVAGFVIVPEHAPVGAVAPTYTPATPGIPDSESYDPGSPASGLSQPAYDSLRIARWALLIVGALLVIVGLISYASTRPRRHIGDRLS